MFAGEVYGAAAWDAMVSVDAPLARDLRGGLVTVADLEPTAVRAMIARGDVAATAAGMVP